MPNPAIQVQGEDAFIYKIVSPTGRIYIGKTANLKRRITRYRNNECDKQRLLYHSLKKYGFKNHQFEVIFNTCKPELDYWEKYFIKEYNSCYFNNRRGLNLSLGGEGTFGHKHAESSKILMSKKKKGNYKEKPIYQFDLSGVFIKKWFSARVAQNHYGSGASLIRAALAGRRDTAYKSLWSFSEIAPEYEQPSKSNRVYKKGGLPRNKTGIDWKSMRKGRNRKEYLEQHGRPVARMLNSETIDTFSLISIAATKFDLEEKNIQACCKGRRAKCGGFNWRYL